MDAAAAAPATQDARPWTDPDDVAGDVLSMLAEHVGLDLWMLTHVEGPRQTALAVHPSGAIQPGMSLPWSATFCRRMVAGEAPQVASVVSAVPPYAELRGELGRLGLGLPGAYIGVPIRRGDGSLYGTLCGFAMRAQPPTLRRHLRLVQFGGTVIATAIENDRGPQGVPAVGWPIVGG